MTVLKRIAVRDRGEFLCGVLLLTLGGFAWWLASDLRFGTAMRMGPGYMPVILAWIVGGFGLVLCFRALAVSAPPPGGVAWRPIAGVGAAIAAFTALETIGMVASIVALVLLACAADRETRWREAAPLAALLAAFSASLFVKALGLPLPLWPAFVTG